MTVIILIAVILLTDILHSVCYFYGQFIIEKFWRTLNESDHVLWIYVQWFTTIKINVQGLEA